MTTYTKRTNAKRAAIKAGIPAEQVEITVHKKDGEVRFGFKKKETQAVAPAKASPAAKRAPAASTPAAPRVERNGVLRPRAGGACAAVWEALDKLHASGTVPATKDVRDLATAKNWNENNAVIELSRWRKFNGIARTHNMKPKKQKAQAKLAAPARRVDGSVDQYLA